MCVCVYICVYVCVCVCVCVCDIKKLKRLIIHDTKRPCEIPCYICKQQNSYHFAIIENAKTKSGEKNLGAKSQSPVILQSKRSANWRHFDTVSDFSFKILLGS